MNSVSFVYPCLGYELRADITMLDEGVHVLLVGGSTTHVGAVTFADEDGIVETLQLPGHRDAVVSESWAVMLAAHFCMPVSVACGIHYDGIAKTQIGEVLEAAQQLLPQAIAKLEQ